MLRKSKSLKNQLEKSVRHEVKTLAQCHGWYVIENDPHHGMLSVDGDSRAFRVRQGEAGQSDLILIRPTDVEEGSTLCDVLLVELKRPKGGVVSFTQQAWHSVMRQRGFVVIVARSWQDVVTQAQEHSVTVERRMSDGTNTAKHR